MQDKIILDPIVQQTLTKEELVQFLNKHYHFTTTVEDIMASPKEIRVDGITGAFVEVKNYGYRAQGLYYDTPDIMLINNDGTIELIGSMKGARLSTKLISAMIAKHPEKAQSIIDRCEANMETLAAAKKLLVDEEMKMKRALFNAIEDKYIFGR